MMHVLMLATLFHEKDYYVEIHENTCSSSYCLINAGIDST